MKKEVFSINDKKDDILNPISKLILTQEGHNAFLLRILIRDEKYFSTEKIESIFNLHKECCMMGGGNMPKFLCSSKPEKREVYITGKAKSLLKAISILQSSNITGSDEIACKAFYNIKNVILKTHLPDEKAHKEFRKSNPMLFKNWVQKEMGKHKAKEKEGEKRYLSSHY